ncbi:MAG: hypothetical protein ABIZ91_20475 [Gemmatimonadaceae bacterium]
MIYHINVSSVLRETVCDLYTNLVTRPTGVAVRRAIEAALAEQPEPNVTIIDFAQVKMLDFSCADEVVGKLLDAYQHLDEGRPRHFFRIRGVHEGHLEAIEAVLERYNLAVLVEDDAGVLRLVGTLDDGARRAWHVVNKHGRIMPQEIARELGEPAGRATIVLEDLSARRLVVRREDGYVSLPQAW